MFYFDLEHNVKKDSSSKNTFHYLTRTAHFKNDAKHDGEVLEWVKSGNMPQWADGRPDLFWAAADKHEIARGRTSSAITIALPNGLTVQQRQDLAKDLIQEFATQHQLPYTAAIHTHKSSITGEEQPHLHLMYSERSLSDGLERLPEQFFSQYRPKNPTKGGAPKLTANALGYGKNQIQAYREITETVINQHLQQFAPTKKLLIGGIEVEVSSLVSCLSNKEYNKKHGTQLEDVPQIARWKLYADDLPPEVVEDIESKKAEIKAIRERNNMQLYAKEYEAALKQQQEQAHQITPLSVEQPKQPTPQEQIQEQLDREVADLQAEPLVHSRKFLPPDSDWRLMGYRNPAGLYSTSIMVCSARHSGELIDALKHRGDALSHFFSDDAEIAQKDHEPIRKMLVNDNRVIERLAQNFGVTGDIVEQAQKQGTESLTAINQHILINRLQELEQAQKPNKAPSYNPSQDHTREKSNDNDYNSDMPSP